jgi:hypothetical protein
MNCAVPGKHMQSKCKPQPFPSKFLSTIWEETATILEVTLTLSALSAEERVLAVWVADEREIVASRCDALRQRRGNQGRYGTDQDA